MATSTLRKIAGLNKIGLPKTRAEFTKAFDTTDVEAMSGLQQAFEGLAEDNPEAYSLWMAASRNAGTPSDIIDNLANSLYQDTKVTGIRGKEAPVDETIESGMPTVETPEEKATLPDPPATPDKPARKASVSPSMRKYASDLGVDISTVTGTGKNGAITKANIEQAARAGEKTAAAASSAPAAPAAPAADDLSDLPVPGGMGVTQRDLDADPAEVIPGAMGLTRDDVRNYLGMGGMLGEPVDAASAPMTMRAPMQPAAPTVPGAMSADDMIALIDSMTPYSDPQPSAGTPAQMPAMDMSKLASARPLSDLLDGFNPPNNDPYGPFPINDGGGYLTEQYGPFPPPPQEEFGPSQFNEAGGFMSGEYGPPRPESVGGGSGNQPWSPFTSRADKFMEAMKLPAGALGIHYATKPADFVARNLLPVGAAAAGTAGAFQYYGGGPSAPPQEVINDLEMQSEQALQNAERGFSTFGAPPKPQMQMPQERPRGRSL